MNRPTNAALKLAGIAVALSCLGGALTGCGGSDSDGGSEADAPSDSDSASESASESASNAPKDSATDGFCEKLLGISAAAGQAKPGDTSAAVKGLQDWVADMEDYEAPSELSDKERQGLEVLIATFEEVDEGASLEELQALGTDASKADTEKVEALSTWMSENCPPPVMPSDGAS